MFQENSIETCILSRMKQITGLGWMHETSARTWCSGKTGRERVGREVGGGDRDGEDMWIQGLFISMYDKIHYKKKKKKVIMENHNKSHGLIEWLGSSSTWDHSVRTGRVMHRNWQSKSRRIKKQRNIFQTKEQNKRPEKDLKEMKISDLQDKELKVIYIRTFSKSEQCTEREKI